MKQGKVVSYKTLEHKLQGIMRILLKSIMTDLHELRLKKVIPRCPPSISAFAPSQKELDTKGHPCVSDRGLLPKGCRCGLDQEWLPCDRGGDDQPPSPPE